MRRFAIVTATVATGLAALAGAAYAGDLVDVDDAVSDVRVIDGDVSVPVDVAVTDVLDVDDVAVSVLNSLGGILA